MKTRRHLLTTIAALLFVAALLTGARAQSGSAAATLSVRLFRDLNPGTDSGSPQNLVVVHGSLYFSATDGTNGVELWKTDGTAAGTVMVKNINSTGDSSPANLTALNNILYFTANDGTNGIELWKSDGTAAGTVMVKDINPLRRQLARRPCRASAARSTSRPTTASTAASSGGATARPPAP